MRIEVQTIVDKVPYNRVPSIRNTINETLKQQLIEKGALNVNDVKYDIIEIKGNCCSSLQITAYVEND